MSSRLSDLPGEQDQDDLAKRSPNAAPPLVRLSDAITPRIAWFVVALLVTVLGVLGTRYYLTASAELTEVALARRGSVAQLAAATLSERHERMLDVSVSLATRVRFADLVAAGQWEAAAQI